MRHELVIVVLDPHLPEVVQLQMLYVCFGGWDWFVFDLEGGCALIEAAEVDSLAFVGAVVLECCVEGHFCEHESIEQFLVLVCYF